MSRLDVLRAERDAIEDRDDWGNPALDYLNRTIEALERTERDSPPAPAAPAGQAEADALAKLAADMERAAGDIDHLTDAQRAELLGRYNSLATARPSQPEAIDLAELQRDMLAAGADPNALSEDQRAELMGRYNRFARQREPVARLDSLDLGERMRAALEAHKRGEDVPDELVNRLTGPDFMAWQQQRLDAERDPANLPPEIQDAGRVLYEAEAQMGRPADPVEAALGDLRTYVASLRPPSVAEQLAELGVEPEPEIVGTTNQEA